MNANVVHVAVEGLEARWLCAATPVARAAAVIPPVITDLVQFNVDQARGRKLLAQDRQVVARDQHFRTSGDPNLVAELNAALQKLADDRAAYQQTIAADLHQLNLDKPKLFND